MCTISTIKSLDSVFGRNPLDIAHNWKNIPIGVRKLYIKSLDKLVWENYVFAVYTKLHYSDCKELQFEVWKLDACCQQVTKWNGKWLIWKLQVLIITHQNYLVDLETLETEMWTRLAHAPKVMVWIANLISNPAEGIKSCMHDLTLFSKLQLHSTLSTSNAKS